MVHNFAASKLERFMSYFVHGSGTSSLIMPYLVVLGRRTSFVILHLKLNELFFNFKRFV